MYAVNEINKGPSLHHLLPARAKNGCPNTINQIGCTFIRTLPPEELSGLKFLLTRPYFQQCVYMCFSWLRFLIPIPVKITPDLNLCPLKHVIKVKMISRLKSERILCNA